MRGVKTTEAPACAASQLYSRTFPLIATRCAFLSSSRFFTTHGPPIHDNGFVKWLFVMVMSEGTMSAIAGSAPPISRFSPAPSR